MPNDLMIPMDVASNRQILIGNGNITRASNILSIWKRLGTMPSLLTNG